MERTTIIRRDSIRGFRSAEENATLVEEIREQIMPLLACMRLSIISSSH